MSGNQRKIERAQKQFGINPGITPGSPLDAFRQNKGYIGPNMADKGQKDGSCNRTACQLPLKGRPQWFMINPSVTDGRFYYCQACAVKFRRADLDMRQPLRCTFDETTGHAR